MNSEKGKLFKNFKKTVEERWFIISISTLFIILLLISFFILSFQSHKGKIFISDLKFRFGLYDFSTKGKSLDKSINSLFTKWNVKKEDFLKTTQTRKEKGKEVWYYHLLEIILPKNVKLTDLEKDFREEIPKAGGEIYNFEQYKKDNFEVLKFDIGIKPIHTHSIFLKQPIYFRIAILIDDLGWDEDIAKDLLKIDAPLSLSIIPKLPFSKSIAEEAKQKNRDILIHIPMESHDPQKMKNKNEFLRTTTEKEILEKQVEDYLLSVPYAIGVNNHMGSKFTEDREAMEIVLRKIKEKNLFFVDSMTSPKSIAYKLAQELEIKTGYRSVFLDNVKEMGYIKTQILELMSLSKKNGEAIGIAHPDKNTLSAIKDMLPRLSEDGIMIVPISHLVR